MTLSKFSLSQIYWYFCALNETRRVFFNKLFWQFPNCTIFLKLIIDWSQRHPSINILHVIYIKLLLIIKNKGNGKICKTLLWLMLICFNKCRSISVSARKDNVKDENYERVDCLFRLSTGHFSECYNEYTEISNIHNLVKLRWITVIV